jgi:hypothetical protein
MSEELSAFAVKQPKNISFGRKLDVIRLAITHVAV